MEVSERKPCYIRSSRRTPRFWWHGTPQTRRLEETGGVMILRRGAKKEERMLAWTLISSVHVWQSRLREEEEEHGAPADDKLTPDIYRPLTLWEARRPGPRVLDRGGASRGSSRPLRQTNPPLRY